MVIQINDTLTLNAAETADYIINDQIEGLSIPDIRTSSDSFSGREGGYVGAQLLSMRNISIPGRCIGQSVSQLEDRRAALQAALFANATGNLLPVTIKVTTNAGRSYRLECNLINFQMPIDVTLFKADFKIDLLATDPLIYDDTAGSELSATVDRTIGGGVEWPVVWPVIWQPGTQPTTVTNGGTSFVYPTITLNGLASNPSIANATTGQVFSLDNISTADGDQIVIDMANRTVTLNGGSIFNKVSSDSQWWGLPVGSSSVTLDSAGGGDTVTAPISWRSGYLGI